MLVSAVRNPQDAGPTQEYRPLPTARKSVRVEPTPIFVGQGEIALFRCRKECSCVGGVLGRYQDLDLTEPIEGEAVGLAQRLAASRGGNTVSVQKRAYLCLLRLALRGVDDDPIVFHLRNGNTPSC